MFSIVEIDSSFFYRPSTMTLIWVIIFSSDWLMNYWGAKLYHGRVKDYWIFENGYNINHIPEDEVAKPLKFAARFLSALLMTTTGIWILLYTCMLSANWKFYEFFCGAFVLLEACIHFRHLRNVALFSLVKKTDGLQGRITVPRWITLRNAFIEFATFALSFLLIYFFDAKNFFVLGGMMSCLVSSLYHLVTAEKEKKEFMLKTHGAGLNLKSQCS